MESVTNTTPESGDTDSLAVGHAGLYKMEEFTEKVTSFIKDKIEEPKEMLADIELGLKDGGKTLITCEKGIKTFVKDELAKGDNHLPNSELGVWIHYLTEGIKKDFGRTWNETPKSLRPKRLATPKTLKSGKRIPSKSDKNLLLDKLDMKYYQDDIAAGLITLQDAFASITEVLEQKKELEDAGYYLSPNKTEGIKQFDWSKVVETATGDANAAKLYRKEKVEIVLPNIIENFYKTEKRVARKIVKDVLKSVLTASAFKVASRSGVIHGVYEEGGASGGFQNQDVNSLEELYDFLEEANPGEVKEFRTSKVSAVHLVKLKKPGMMADRWVCFDLFDTKKNMRKLVLIGQSGNQTFYEK